MIYTSEWKDWPPRKNICPVHDYTQRVDGVCPVCADMELSRHEYGNN